MENKKQLVIVPPMSEPLQKLNEVLNGIAADENIEISLISENKELSQFLGSAGQCLLAFSNAKLCATFLQENRFVLAKTHSKVILLTPKEIPAKTLVKFTKLGLTEAILENSPPKTLLYKVKLLLRSIKTTSIAQEDKDQVIKSMLEAKETQNTKEELAVGSNEEAASVNYMAEERAKFKKSTEEDSVDYGDPLKGKKSTQEETIETHWKSKRKQDDSSPDEIEDDATRIDDDPSSIDKYYRGKRKKENEELLPEEDTNAKKLSKFQEEEEAEEKKRHTNIELDLIPGEKEKKKYQEEEEEGYSLKTSKKLDLLKGEETPKPKFDAAEDEEETKKKELDELEALFEAAKKRQAEASEDLGGHYKGKIAKIQDEEEEPEITESKEYDNSELNEPEKSVELDLIAGDDDNNKKRQFEEEEQEEKKREGFKEEIKSNMTGEEGQVDKLNTRMMGELGEDSSKNIRTKDIFDRDTSKDHDEEPAENQREAKKDAQIDEEKNGPLLMKREIEETPKRSREESINLDLIPADSEDKEKLQNEDNDNDKDRAKSTKLNLIDGDDEDKKSGPEEEENEIGFKKLDNTNLDLEKSSDKKSSHGKVDKIDTFYRSGESKKKEHSWDNLDEKNNVEIALEKGAKREESTAQKAEKKDYGEVTIDYRKLKEEFEAISRSEGEAGHDEISEHGDRRSANDDEDKSFKVIELDARGFDFSIEIINLIYQKDIKPAEFYKIISEELISRYKAFSVFYTFKTGEKKHSETFNTFTQSTHSDLTVELKDWWQNHKEDNAIFQDYYSKSMATWICRELKKDNSDAHWEDIELPTWAINELTNKQVELVYPYYDGVDRMGVAFLLFPNGLNPKFEKGIEVTLELARTLQLDTIQRKSAPNDRREENAESEAVPEKKKILSMFSGMFKGNKAG